GWVAMQAADKIGPANVKTGQAAFFNATDAKPGNARKITPKDLPAPGATKSATNFPPAKMLPWAGKMPTAPAGFKVELYASGLTEPRQIRTAPNGDLFFTEKKSGELKIARGYKDGKAESISLFASGLDRPWGILFYPATNPQFVYVGNAGSLVRFPYKTGDLKASGAAQKMADLPIKKTPGDYHDTRDLALTKDGTILVSVGSGSNIDDPDKVPEEKNRAAVHEFKADGTFIGIYASGIRNPVGLGVNPTSGEAWVSVNERDNLGDNLVPDYVSSIKKGGFYGWPYYYIGGNIDERLGKNHPELQSKVIVPDVLIQPHSASLGFSFYTGTAFPQEYRGDLFVAEHGSWNRAARSGAEVVRVPLDAKGKATGVYQDFLTGFAAPGNDMYGRPASVAVGSDGALYVTDDGSLSIWRVSYVGTGGAAKAKTK
ncbi:MAG: PQQ-dependent sugar dehydrogenase, partial [Acidobacteriota bacterium]